MSGSMAGPRSVFLSSLRATVETPMVCSRFAADSLDDHTWYATLTLVNVCRSYKICG